MIYGIGFVSCFYNLAIARAGIIISSKKNKILTAE
jgi:hypothetical protein